MPCEIDMRASSGTRAGVTGFGAGR
jgi:hypothetical protein